jgi:hypothetical protein
MFDNDHLVNAYDTETPANAHKLACVFLIMAIGVMFDLNRQPCECTSCRSTVCADVTTDDPRGEQLFTLGRACLNVVGLEHGSPATVQALHLCGTYLMNDKRVYQSQYRIMVETVLMDNRWEWDRDILADPRLRSQGSTKRESGSRYFSCTAAC